ncbi:MAG: translation elongation factor-like protein [Nanoarchaeota archaeon]|nr:translation elongation factor-like protein [Nanoarchaeota archaeon]MBU0962513.1 translation elongation factor-like protein [Nanoarchaeota archaeon]
MRAVKETKKQIGTITHFYNHINVAVVLLIDTIKEGDTISIEGETTNFKQKVSSMQIDMKPIKIAVKGQEIGLKVKDRARTHDIIYKIE